VKQICELSQVYMDIETAKTAFKSDNSNKNLLLSKSIEKFLELNKPDQALEAAKAIEDDQYKTIGLRYVCKGFIEINNISEAIDVARLLPDPSEKEKTLEYLLSFKTN
jgi:hypothetical protein